MSSRMRDEWLIFGGGPTVKEYKDQILRYIELNDPVVVGTNWMPKWIMPEYHVIVNRKNYARYKKNLRGIKVGASKIKNLDIYLDIDNKYPAKRGYFKMGDKIKMAGATVGMYALAFAIQEGAKLISMVGFDGFKDPQKTHWYRTEQNWKRCQWQQQCTKDILKNVSKLFPIKILTPTVFEEYYEGF
ncbi:hypothetical protein LCGC14_1681630 [marine sediment metagenome]|uniref:DUF115 domain-containing protein n=1 Tax=marine sediment metagenome TaxID=412755 RepID=A0A0F9IAV5_9ZZZZ